MIKKIIIDNKFFYYPYLCLFFFSSIVLFLTDKGFLTVKINSHHTLVFDFFFKYYTYIGTGFLLIPLAIFLFFKNRPMSLFLLSTYIINGLFVFVIKRFLIADNFRPYWHIKGVFHQVEGVEIQKLFSMPSGHTNTAFLIFLTLCFFTKNKLLHGFYLVCALLVAVSRMYLYQHFFVDTVVGSAFAVVLTTIMYMFYLNKKWVV